MDWLMPQFNLVDMLLMVVIIACWFIIAYLMGVTSKDEV